MRVIAPFTTRHPDAERALREHAPGAEWWDVSESLFSYSQLVEDLWKTGESFLIVEHDIEVNQKALAQAKHCNCSWGVSPYKASSFYGFEEAPLLSTALGFTRFGASLLREFPDAVSRANAIDDEGSICPPGDWRRFDARLYSVLTDPKNGGRRPHIHAEVIHHHHYSNYGCSCGRDHEEA
jgi:hypothetical protein